MVLRGAVRRRSRCPRHHWYLRRDVVLGDAATPRDWHSRRVGARVEQIVALVLGESLKLAAHGVGIGVAVALAAAR